MAAAREHRWSRSRYPLQAPSKQLSFATSPLKVADNSSLDQLSKNTPDTNESAPWYRAVTGDQASQYSVASQLGHDSNLSSHQHTEDFQATDESCTAVSVSQRSTSPFSINQDYQSHLGKAEDTSPFIQYLKNGQDEASHVSSQWSQSTQATTETSTEHQSPTPEEEHEQLPVHAPKPDQSGAMKRTLRRTPRSRRINSPTPPAGAQEASTSVQPTEDEQKTAASGTSPWKRQAYPLHSASSGSSTQHSAPPTPEKKSELANTAHSGQLEANKGQSTVSDSRDQQVDLSKSSNSGSTALPASPPSSDSESEDMNKTPTNQLREGNQAVKRKNPWNRRNYPLQTPASNANLRHSPTPPPSPGQEPEHASKIPADQLPDNNQAATRSKTLRRQVYPLQSPASIMNLRPSPSLEQNPEHTNEVSTDQTGDDSPATTRSRTFRRPLYPLQIPTSIANVQRPTTPLPPVEGESQKEDESSAKKSRERELATKVISQWRRQVYPVQSPKNLSPFQRIPAPRPPEEDAEKDRKPKTIHLPKNLRAVTDADKHDPKGRTIVVCLDGTGDKFDNDNSNIVHIVSALKKDDPQQVTYYQAGIGTYSAGGLSNGISAAMDMAVGSGLGLHVRDAYHFLMHTYKEGDKICIFGFSRGAYTARCLAGMIHKVGLLPPRNIEQIPFAYEFYTNDTPEGWKQSEDFKKTFCIDVCVYFLGCFDSVASVGFIPRQLPLSSTPTSKPRYFRHAMALDERRAKFKICRHQTKKWDEIKEGASPTDAIAKSAQSNHHHRFLSNHKAQDDAPTEYSPYMKYGKTHHPNVTDEEYEGLTRYEAPFDTNVLEVWFAGAHADIGGGAVPNDERHKLAQIPLRWMIRQAFECETGIIFKTKVLAEHGLDVHTLWPKYKSLSVPVHGPPPSYLEKYDKCLPPRSIRRSKLVPIDKHEKGEQLYHFKSHKDEDWTPEQVEDFYDAMAQLNDQLIDVPTWWILELWPVQYKVPTAPGEVSVITGMNLGRYRGVEDVEPNVHWTVLQRVQHMNYKIQARTAPHTSWRAVV
ncbi:hypothetical protein H2198_004161 [Neophaeococcomyces mojaviensis]|uniref:Uncharacterized protein n=1 Tax=Neophaeococcomyces mojaviensis TaxID=3383035 RepID=A0ACC3A980_9EURO|nr:hypothetical protein H2198_004161 [Knufia sp. JES_112]